jgi:hypothetical protein
VIVTGVLLPTDEVVAAKVALVAPAAIVTLAGTVATPVLLLESDTPAPPAGAAAVSVAVPVDPFPPTTDDGLTLTACRLAAAATGVTVRVVVRLAPPYVAVMVTAVLAATDDVVTAKVALVPPAAIVTLAGTVATPVLLLASDTTAPPDGAAAVSVAVPVDPLPPTTLAGLTETADKPGAVVVARGVKRRVEENGPKTPAALRARTRHHRRCAGRPDSVTCDTATVGFATNGAASVEVLSTCTS